jgi:predicted nucleic acid-binding protein
MRGVVVDANLFLLFAVGAYNRSQIERHRRLRTHFDAAAFDLLIGFIAQFDKIVVVPGLLAEVSNLLSDGADPTAIGIKKAFAVLVQSAVEVYYPSKETVAAAEFAWLGLSDVAQLHAAEASKSPLITDDGPLFSAALRRGISSVHFASIRQRPYG